VSPGANDLGSRDIRGRKYVRQIIAVTIAVLVPVALAACGSSVTTSTSQHTAVPGTTSIGETLTLTASGAGSGDANEDIAVTVVKMVLSPSSSEAGFASSPGDQWVAFEIRIKNLYSAPYVDSPNDSMTAVDAAEQGTPPADDAPTTVGPQFSGQLALTTGSTADGVVTFQAPSGDKITMVEFAPDGGDGADVGKWAVG
jgi:hypothetical protein